MLLQVLHKNRFSKYLKLNPNTSSKKKSCICHYDPHHSSEVHINFIYPILLQQHIFLQLFSFLCSLILFISIPLLLSRLLNVLHTYFLSNHAVLFHVCWECHKDISKQNYMYTKHHILKEIMSVFC
jgi:hypothetical protein